jgi:hypothetical protein
MKDRRGSGSVGRRRRDDGRSVRAGQCGFTEKANADHGWTRMGTDFQTEGNGGNGEKFLARKTRSTRKGEDKS